MGGFVLHRLRAHRLLILAAVLTVLLTTAMLAALTGLASGVSDAAARRALQVTDRAATPLMMSVSAKQSANPDLRRVASSITRNAFAGLPVTLRTLSISDSLGLPYRPGQNVNNQDLTSVADLDRSLTRLTAGRWPSGGLNHGVLEVAVPQAAVTGVGPAGTELRVRDRFSDAQLTLRIVGVFAVKDTQDVYWQLDPLGGHGVQPGVGAQETQYGPLLADPAVFAPGGVTQQTVAFEGLADFGQITADRLDALAQSYQDAINAPRPSVASSLQAGSHLPQIVAELDQSILVARSTLLVLALQLVLLAAMTLLLAARLLAEQREAENALLRARGAAPRRIVRLAVIEGLLLALPAAGLAPLLAGPLLRLVDSTGPLRRSGVRLDGPLPAAAWWAAALAALYCAVLVAAPTLARYRTFTETRARRGRRLSRPDVLRGGADLALLALAVVGYLQLRHYADEPTGSGALTSGASGTPSIDPVLVTAPALALAAGAVLTLRLVPLISRLGERIATRGRGLPAALTGWQLSRRPQRGAGPVLALALAAAIGTLALGTSSSWDRAQGDQAAFDTGSDLRLTALHSPAFGQGGGVATTPGVVGVIPVQRETVSLDNGSSAELVELDSRSAASGLSLRSDLAIDPAGASAARLLAPLAEKPPSAAEAGLEIPGRPRTLSLDIQVRRTASPDPTVVPGGNQDSVTLGLTDRFGVSWSFSLGDVPFDGAVHRLTIDLAAAAGTGTPAYPLTLSRVEINPAWDQDPCLRDGHRAGIQHFTVLAIHGDAAPVLPPSGIRWARNDDWGSTNQMTGPSGCFSGKLTVAGVTLSATASRSSPLDVTLQNGIYYPGQSTPLDPANGIAQYTRLVLTPATAEPPAALLPAVVDQRFLATTNTHIGSVLSLPAHLAPCQLVIVGVVSHLPGTGTDAEQGLSGSMLSSGNDMGASVGGTVLVDQRSYDRRFELTGDSLTTSSPQPIEWWVTTAPGQEQAVAAKLRARPDTGLVFVRDEVAASFRQDPIGSGPQAGLFAAVGLAVLLAAVGFGVDASGTVRARGGEFAVLSALGLRRRELARSTAAELALPVLLGVGIGALLGELLTRLVVPLLVLTPRGVRPVPPVLVSVPGLSLALLLAAIAAVPLTVAGLVGLRGGDTARRLRRPEES
ncbi:hypothetical protein ABIA32_001778 [Streptacidiphilus sp. MAP12-20]|uniref:FtsX-like permease family protein n=1 Tax=Streptacidiphilus sp. MAP12-20 TaxID=3156299 RepID=UPI003517E615